MTKRMKTPPRKKADVSSAELAEMKRLKTDEGLTHSQIGGRFNLSPFSVRSLLKGVPSKAEAERELRFQRCGGGRFDPNTIGAKLSADETGDDLSQFALKPGRDRHE